MKKMILTVAIFLVTAGVLAAQTTARGTVKGMNKNNPGYTDANNNNVCDYAENRSNAQFKNMNGCRTGNMHMNRNNQAGNKPCIRQGRRGRA